MSDKPREVIRLHVELFRAMLAPLAQADRVEILEALDLTCARMVTDANAEVERLQKRLRELEFAEGRST